MNGQFQIATHILTLLSKQHATLLSSDYISGSININPALVRKEIINLRTAGLISSKEGKAGGYSLALSPQKITLADVYKAVKHQAPLGHAKNKPNPACPIGRQINKRLDDIADDVETAIVKKLSAVTLADFLNQFD